MSRQTKIFLLSDSLNNLQGGAERQIYELIKNIDKEKFKIYLGCLSKRDGALKDLAKFDIEVLRFAIDRIYDFKGIASGFKFKKFLKEEGIDTLVTYHFGSDIWGAIFGKMAGVSRIISNRRDMGFWRKSIHVWAYRFVNRWVNRIIVVSGAIKEKIVAEEKVSQDKIDVIYNGIDLKRFAVNFDKEHKRQELNIPADATLIGCVGNLREVKGHKYFIEAAATVLKSKPDTHFVLIGRGDSERELRAQIDQLGLASQVHLLGQRTDVPQLLASMDICVLPSLSEGLSNTLLEYMASEKAIVATKVGGNPEVIKDGDTGLLVNEGSSAELADRLLRLLNNQKEAKRLSVNAKEDVVQRFNIHDMVQRYEHLISSV